MALGAPKSQPRMATRRRGADPVATHADRRVDDPPLVAALQRQRRADPALEQIDGRPHPTQVAQPFLADIGHKPDVALVGDGVPLQRLGQVQQPGDPQAVVAQAGAVDPLALTAHGQVGPGREHSVDVRGDQQAGTLGVAGAPAVDIADGVGSHVGKAERAHPFGDIGAAPALVEGGRGDLLNGDRRLDDRRAVAEASAGCLNGRVLGPVLNQVHRCLVSFAE